MTRLLWPVIAGYTDEAVNRSCDAATAVWRRSAGPRVER
jgi:hypothetical protein